jgi:type IV secretion system protein VirB4
VAQEAVVNKIRKVDRKLHHESAEDFIPVACHYNENTLLTKNGELIQIIQINGINAQHISEKLLNMREILNEAIKNSTPTDGSIAFWLHTIRRRANLDDTTKYNKLFSANLHNSWKEKNYWHDKFVNTLYISIIHTSDIIALNDISTLINAVFYKTIAKKGHDFLDAAYVKLNDISNKILHALEAFGAQKLGITYEDGECFSDMIALYRRIVRLNEDRCLVPIGDLSTYIATNKYAIGGDKIEVRDDSEKKFAAVLSIKEYHESSARALDRFLQLPIELIATEIFYFIDKKHAIPIFKEQSGFLKISKDERLASAKGLDEINANDPETRFCNQQITISMLSGSVEGLEKNIAQASINLAELGIVHVREDINLEQSFWAQLPGNFSFLRRMNTTTLRHITALASLHNFPTGLQYNIWGKSITLLRTEKGTPYFMNFHDDANKGNTGIFGGHNTGKTVLMNFLISESTKFNPTILYVSANSDSEIFINAIEGKWIDAEQHIINPFLLEDNLDNQLFVYEFLKIITNHYVVELSQEELKFLEELTKTIFALPENERIFSNILETKDLFKNATKNIKARFDIFAKAGAYAEIFDSGANADFGSSQVLGVNLYKFTDEYYSAHNMPDDHKLIDKFNVELKLNSSVRAGIIYALFYYHNKIDNNPKILAFDNALSLLNIENFKGLINEIHASSTKNNGVVVSNFSIEAILKKDESFAHGWLEALDTIIILPNDAKQSELRQKLQMTQLEVETLSSISTISRLLLIKQSGQSILVELSIGAMTGFVKILSSSQEEREIYKKILQENPGNLEQWLSALYQTLEKN